MELVQPPANTETPPSSEDGANNQQQVQSVTTQGSENTAAQTATSTDTKTAVGQGYTPEMLTSIFGDGLDSPEKVKGFYESETEALKKKVLPDDHWYHQVNPLLSTAKNKREMAQMLLMSDYDPETGDAEETVRLYLQKEHPEWKRERLEGKIAELKGKTVDTKAIEKDIEAAEKRLDKLNKDDDGYDTVKAEIKALQRELKDGNETNQKAQWSWEDAVNEAKTGVGKHRFDLPTADKIAAAEQARVESFNKTHGSFFTKEAQKIHKDGISLGEVNGLPFSVKMEGKELAGLMEAAKNAVYNDTGVYGDKAVNAEAFQVYAQRLIFAHYGPQLLQMAFTQGHTTTAENIRKSMTNVIPDPKGGGNGTMSPEAAEKARIKQEADDFKKQHGIPV